ncbi:FAST kinase domain-containing protein 1, mitochondrial [Hetaerina americana]|uniref:FAST kinase domain-containing protein 1, mitochondrial n=1 Tax=Hetaerina americana TaxID=62018 RepID=UPI003A7F5D87
MVCCVIKSNYLRNIILTKSLWEIWHGKCCSRMNVNYRYLRRLKERLHHNNYCNISLKVVAPLLVKNEPTNKCLIYRAISGSGNETDSDSEGMEDFLERSFIPEEKESVHDILSPNTEDPVVLQLVSTSSVEEVFDVIRENEFHIKAIHLAHSVLALWDLQLSSILLSEKNCVSGSAALIPEAFVAELLSSNYMTKFLELIKDNYVHMSPDELACTLLYLGKMGFSDVLESKDENVNLLMSVVREMFQACETKLNTFSLPALSRLMAGTRFWRHSKPSVFDRSNCYDTIEDIVLQRIDHCSSTEDLRLITICMAHLRPSIGFDSLKKYKKYVADVISKNSFSITDARAVLRAAAYLNLPHWSNLNVDLMRKLLLLFEGKIKELKPSDIVMLNHLLKSQLEPAVLVREVEKTASELLQKKKDSIPVIELMSCLVQSMTPSSKKRFEGTLLEWIHNSCSPQFLPVIFSVLRHLKTSNVHLCDAFWSHTLNYIRAKPAVHNGFRLLRFCHWYMHFNNNLAGTYHHHTFESCITEILLHNVAKWESPPWIARGCAFILAYCRKSSDIEVVLEMSRKLIELVPEFGPEDCFMVSHGLNIAVGMNRNSLKKNKNVMWLWSQLARKLDYWSEEQLKRPGLSLRESNMIMKGFIERRTFNEKGSVIQEHVAKYYDNVFKGHQTSAANSCDRLTGLSSRTVRDNCSVMMGCGWLFCESVEWMCEYIIEHGLLLSGETVDRVVQALFHLNHWPQDGPQFFETVSQVLNRDKERIPGLSLIQVALGLCYFNSLPNSLIHYIFAVEFLEKIDDEIRFCYAKATYPLRVRHSLMELNRAVCLGYPEVDVPWFHTNYCKGIISTETTLRTHIHEAIHSLLLELVGGRKEFIQERAYTPYFHKIDFLLVLDEFKKPVKPKIITQNDVLQQKLTRVAIVIRGPESYCRHSNKARPCLRGLPRLHERHLQLLGYEVVGIPAHFWDSLQMGSHEARLRHIRERIFGQNAEDSQKVT